MSIVNGHRLNIRSSDASVGIVRSGDDFDLSVAGSIASLQSQIDALDLRVDAVEADVVSLDDAIANLSTLNISDVALIVDWRTFSTTTLTTGNHTFGGIQLTAQAPPDGTFRVLNGTGIEFVAGATNTAFSSSSQTSAFWYWSFAELFTVLGIDSTRIVIIEHYFSTITLPTPNVAQGIMTGTWGIASTPSNAAARLRAVVRANVSGAQCLHGITDASGGSNYTTAPASTSNVLGVAINHGNGVSALAGVWGGDWDSSPLTMEVATPAGPSANPTNVKDRNNRSVVAFPTGNTAADMAVVLEQTRIRVAA